MRQHELENSRKLLLCRPSFMTQHKNSSTTLIQRVQKCNSLVTKNIDAINPDLKPYIQELLKFKVFKSFRVNMKTLKLLQSDLGELTKQDEEVKQVIDDDKKFCALFGVSTEEYTAGEYIEPLSLS